MKKFVKMLQKSVLKIGRIKKCNKFVTKINIVLKNFSVKKIQCQKINAQNRPFYWKTLTNDFRKLGQKKRMCQCNSGYGNFPFFFSVIPFALFVTKKRVFILLKKKNTKKQIFQMVSILRPSTYSNPINFKIFKNGLNVQT